MNSIFNHLLVIQPDNCNDNVALNRAIALAEQHQSKVTVFKSFYKQLHSAHYDTSVADDDLTTFVQQQQQDIWQQVSRLTGSDIKPDIVISWRENEKRAIARLIAQSNISMVINQQQSRRSLLSLFSTGLEHYLISDCELPVWLVKAGTNATEMNILACLDVDNQPRDITLNNAILDIGNALSCYSEHELHVINCYCSDNFTMSLPYNESSGFVPLPDVAQQHQHKLQSYIHSHQLPPHCVHLNEGLPDDEIPRTVTELHSQLAIIGNSHMHDISSALLGDTAHYLSEHTPCDVLVVKPPHVGANHATHA
jgi:nucleotide-binding universal stress UspA family protein